jgi:Putative DNA-binding domain
VEGPDYNVPRESSSSSARPPLDFADINAYVTNRSPERPDLDFKRDATRDTRLAKAMAAMANTSGGEIVIGIDAPSDYAERLSPVQLKGIREAIISYSRDAIDEPLRIEIDQVEDPNQPGLGYLVITVPQSVRAPHVVEGSIQGRAGPTNRGLTRREIGELFARSPRDFIKEFGISAPAPARLRADVRRTAQSGIYDLVIKNEGEEDAFDVTFKFLTNPHPSTPGRAPVKCLIGRGDFKLPMMVGGGQRNQEIELTWCDKDGHAQTRTQSLVLG